MELKNLLSKKSPFKDVNVAVIGDLMLDTFVYGSANRISPEAPVPVVRIKNRTVNLGGAGNAAANIRALGANPILIGKIGKDDDGKSFRSICKKARLDDSNLLVASEPTISKTRIVAQGQQIVRIDEEEINPLSTDIRRDVVKAVRAARKKANVLVVSDYAKGMIDQDLLEQIKKIWKTGIIVVDPKPRDDISYSGVNLITPNLKEAGELMQSAEVVDSDSKAEKVVKSLAKKLKLDSVLLTRSGDGITLLSKEKNNQRKVSHQRVDKVEEVRDVSGAGDTVIALLSSGLAIGLPMKESVELANFAASLAVAKTGTVTISWSELMKALKDSKKYPPFMFR